MTRKMFLSKSSIVTFVEFFKLDIKVGINMRCTKNDHKTLLARRDYKQKRFSRNVPSCS